MERKRNSDQFQSPIKTDFGKNKSKPPLAAICTEVADCAGHAHAGKPERFASVKVASPSPLY